MATQDQRLPATAMDNTLEQGFGQGSATGDVQRPPYLGMRTVPKLANRVAARVGRSGMAPVFIGWR